MCQPQYKLISNSLTSRIFIKSTVNPKNLKFGMIITWGNTIVQKKKDVAIATSLDEIDFSARITQRVYIESTDTMIATYPIKELIRKCL